MTFRDQAACLGSDPNLFFSEAEAKVAEALAICDTCPVTDECLADAIEWGDTIGVRGGIQFNGRNQPKKPVGRTRKAPVGYEQCGTDAGYQTHQRRNWKRTHRSAVCKRLEHDKCRSYGCGCHCHVVDFADDEEA